VALWTGRYSGSLCSLRVVQDVLRNVDFDLRACTEKDAV
jgi:hypothetical protein